MQLVVCPTSTTTTLLLRTIITTKYSANTPDSVILLRTDLSKLQLLRRILSLLLPYYYVYCMSTTQ